MRREICAPMNKSISVSNLILKLSEENDEDGEGVSGCLDNADDLVLDPVTFKDPFTGRRRRIFECPHCNKVMQSGWKLRRHMRSHTGNKPFKCGECDKVFVESALLKRHVRTHSGEKPFR